MRISFLAFTIVALVASTMTAASAFNYATLSARTVGATIVTDGNAYLAVTSQDADYACYIAYTNGKIDVTWDSGTSCAGSGTGINAASVYYYHDVLKITNKGDKALNGIWVNMSDNTTVQIQTATSAGAMTTSGPFTQVATYSSLAVGSSIYVGFKLNAASLDTSNSPISKSITVEARSSS